MFHHPNPNFVRLQANNHFRFDHCGSGFPHNPPYISLFPPFVGGGWDWFIPNRFRIVGSGTAGTLFTTTLQQFTIDGSGTVTVSKQGARITRTRSNVVT